WKDCHARHVWQTKRITGSFILNKSRGRSDAPLCKVAIHHGLVQLRVRHVHDRMRLESRPDSLLRTLDFHRAGHYSAHRADPRPLGGELVAAPGQRDFWKDFEVDGFSRIAVARKPSLLRGKAGDRRKPCDRAAEQMVENREACLAFHG